MGLDAGRLKHRIVIKELTLSQDATTGEETKTWSTLDTIWAEFRPLSVREFVAAQSVESQISAMVTIRYRDDVLPNMRIVFRDRTYNIVGALPDPESGLEYLTMPVSEIVNG